MVRTIRRRTCLLSDDARNSAAPWGVPATARATRASQPTVPAASSTARSAAPGETMRKGTCWQRDAMVGITAAAERAIRMK